MVQVNQILQTAAAVLLIFTVLALFSSRRRGENLWTGIGLTIAVLGYLATDSQWMQICWLRPIILTGSICIPVFFWMMSRAIFDDHFRYHSSILFWFLAQAVPHTHHYLYPLVLVPKPIHQALDILSQTVSLGFVFAGIFVAIRTRTGDLIESRRKFRRVFAGLTAGLIGLTLIIESTPLAKESAEVLQILQRSSIIGLSGYFLLANFAFQPGFFFHEAPKPKVATPPDTQLEDQLYTLLMEEKIYREEALTIGRLAQKMNVQEHRLRRLINQQLGFRNFNDFLNQYRVQEASDILADPKANRKTILEIAFAMGYQSIGPFNKAFKEQKNMTPTAFRKAAQAEKSG
jgi:AraC-like DNA-binding protein